MAYGGRVKETSRSNTALAAVALGLAVLGAVLFAIGDAVGPGSPATEDLFMLIWIAGWTLLGWATLLALFVVILLVRRAIAWRWFDIAMLVACVALVGVVACTHPLFGSGSGLG